VKAHDVLADDVQVRRPILLEFLTRRVGKANGRDVVGQRIDPYIHDVFGVARDPYSPIEGGARERKILQTAPHETYDLIHPLLRQHEIRNPRVEVEQLVRIFGQPEEVALLLDPFYRGAMRAETLPALAETRFALVVIGLVADRIPARVFVEIDIAGRLHPFPDSFRGATVTRFGGADEVVVRAVELLHHRLEARHVAFHQLARCQIFLGRGLQHFNAVFVGAGEKVHVPAVEPHEACYGVGGDRLIGVADMGRAVRISDCSRDVIRLAGRAFVHEALVINRAWPRQASRICRKPAAFAPDCTFRRRAPKH